MSRRGLSLRRWWSVVLKEFLQLRRDRLTFGMVIAIPIGQLALFGYAINTEPKHLPTAVIGVDQSEFTRSVVADMKNSEYFEFVGDRFADTAALFHAVGGRNDTLATNDPRSRTSRSSP